MQRFIVQANIEHFRLRLATATDAKQREAIIGLLEEEILKLPPEERPEIRRAAFGRRPGPAEQAAPPPR